MFNGDFLYFTFIAYDIPLRTLHVPVFFTLDYQTTRLISDIVVDTVICVHPTANRNINSLSVVWICCEI